MRVTVVPPVFQVCASRKLIIDVPPEIPEGVAMLTFASVEAEPVDAGPQVPPQNRASDDGDPIFRLCGCHKGVPGASVDDFLARRREDRELEFAIEERRLDERKRYAKLST
ncbi:hypothetical protein R80B4_02566 [Fibrobacteres bacterium R8-0-B4]